MRTSNVNKAKKSQRTKRRRVCSKGWKKGRHRGQFAKHLGVFAFPVLFFFPSFGNSRESRHDACKQEKNNKKMKRKNGVFAWLRDEKRVAIHADCFRACPSMCARSWVDVIGTPLNMVCRSAPVVHLMFFFFGENLLQGITLSALAVAFSPSVVPNYVERAPKRRNRERTKECSSGAGRNDGRSDFADWGFSFGCSFFYGI